MRFDETNSGMLFVVEDSGVRSADIDASDETVRYGVQNRC